MDQLWRNVSDWLRVLKGQAIGDHISPNRLRDIYSLDLGDKTSQSELNQLVYEYTQKSVNTQSPYFVNQLYGGIDPIAAFGEWITTLLNTSMATFEIAPLATLMEREMIQKIGGFLHGSSDKTCGLMTPGGSQSNLMALLCAKQKLYPDSKEKGWLPNQHVILVSKESHYSFKKAALVMGMGTDQVWGVEVDEYHQMDIEDLKLKIKKAKTENKKVLLVGATVGTTVWGAFDPVSEMSEVCKVDNTWLHIDGSWGGVRVFDSESYKKEWSLGNSFTMDFHKYFNAGLLSAFFITQEKETFELAAQTGGQAYIFHTQEENLDLGPYSLQCGRRVDSFKTWLYWKSYGDEGLRQKVQDGLGVIAQIKAELLQNKNFKLLHDPSFLNVCFQVIDSDGENDQKDNNQKRKDNLHKSIREDLMKSGACYINFSENKKDGTFFRFVLSQNHFNLDHFKVILDSILKSKKTLENF